MARSGRQAGEHHRDRPARPNCCTWNAHPAYWLGLVAKHWSLAGPIDLRPNRHATVRPLDRQALKRPDPAANAVQLHTNVWPFPAPFLLSYPLSRVATRCRLRLPAFSRADAPRVQRGAGRAQHFCNAPQDWGHGGLVARIAGRVGVVGSWGQSRQSRSRHRR